MGNIYVSRTTNLFALYPAWKIENYYFLWGLSFVPPKSHPFFSHSLSSHYNESFVNNSLFFRVSLRLSNALLDLARLWQNGIMLYVLFCHLSSFGVNLWESSMLLCIPMIYSFMFIGVQVWVFQNYPVSSLRTSVVSVFPLTNNTAINISVTHLIVLKKLWP